MYGALNSNDDADSENFVQLVSSPSESDLDNDNFYLGNYTDEYGGFTGIVTLCDIMEYLVGDLENTATA